MLIDNKNSGFFKFSEYVIYGFFAIFPFFIFKNFLYQGSSSRFLILCLTTSILAIGLSFYLFKKKNGLSFVKSPIIYIFGAYLLFLFISAIFGYDFQTSFWSRAERTSGLFYLIHLSVFTLFLINIVFDRESRENLLGIVSVTSALYSIFSLLGPQGFDIIFRNNPYDGFLFGNSSFAAMYLLGAFLISIFYVFTKDKKERLWQHYILPVAIVINPFLINITGPYENITSVLGISKASSIAFFVALGILTSIFLISKIKNIKVKNIIGGAFVIISFSTLIFVMISLLNPNGLIRGIYEKQSTLARPVAWEVSSIAIKERPLTGWGIDNFTDAYQENFDIRLLTEEYGNEPWFDRAHNIILDQGVDTGYIGLFFYFSLYAVIFICLLYVLFKTKNKEDGFLASLLATYFFVHLLELQTAFDTTISAVMFALMVSLSVYVFYRTKEDALYKFNFVFKNFIAFILLIIFSWTLLFGTLPFWGIQNINGKLRTVGSAEKRLPLYEKLFDTKVDPAGILWRTSTDFQRGIAEDPSVLENPEKVKYLSEEVAVITSAYEKYVNKHPKHFRSRLNLADLYIYQMLFGVDKLKDADKVLDDAIEISSKHPQPYWMKAVLSLYGRDFKSARDYVKKAKEMNPDVVETKRLEEYIEESIKTFPEITLYSFDQI